MNCEHWEQPIYLYRELTAAEQAAVTRHVATCAHCSALFEAVQHQYVLTRQAASTPQEAPEPARLTKAIMAAITPTRRRHVVMDSPWLRYSTAAASALLIVAFLLEQPWAQGGPSAPIATAPPPAAGHSPVMDTKAFIKVSQQKRAIPEKSLFALYVDCIQHNDCDNAAVRNFKTKMKL